MAKKQNGDRLGLRREPEERRRFRWWIVPLVLVVVGILVGGFWLFRPRIERAFEPQATLPPTLPTPVADSSGDGGPSDDGGGEETASGGDESGALYTADFEPSGDWSVWEVFDDGVLKTEIFDGQLVVTVDGVSDLGGWSGLNYTLEDFVLEVDAEKLGGPDDNGIIVVFRLVDEDNYNRFDISSDGYYTLSKVRDGEAFLVSDWTTTDAIKMGEAINRLRVTAVGNTFSFEVNGTPLILCVSDEEGVQPIPMEDECVGGEYVTEWVDDVLPRGKIGLGAQGFVRIDDEGNTTKAQAVIGFDNLVISAP